jgi:hypothetical protein
LLGAATSSVTRQYLAPPGPESGYGVGGIPFSMREMTQEKMRVFRYPA